MPDTIANAQEPLISLQESLSAKLLDLKHEEISWIKIFLIYYAGAIGLTGLRLTVDDLPSQSERLLCIGIAVASTVAAWLSCRTMIELRHSYFGIARHLVKAQSALGLYGVDEQSSAKAPMGDSPWRPLLHPFTTRAEWRDATNPKATFRTRLTLLIAASIISTGLAGARVAVAEASASTNIGGALLVFAGALLLQLLIGLWAYFIRDYSKVEHGSRTGVRQWLLFREWLSTKQNNLPYLW